jgi:hypothetical protein
LGSVIGISTDKLRARGPVGPDELTTYKAGVLKRSHLKVEALASSGNDFLASLENLVLKVVIF